MAANENIGVYEPGRDLTVHATEAVTGKRFVKVSGNRVSGADGGNLSVAHADAGGRAAGVSKYDAPAGGKLGLHRGNSRVTFVTAGAAITAFSEVEVGTAGRAIPKASGVAVGYAVTGAASGADAEISLY